MIPPISASSSASSRPSAAAPSRPSRSGRRRAEATPPVAAAIRRADPDPQPRAVRLAVALSEPSGSRGWSPLAREEPWRLTYAVAWAERAAPLGQIWACGADPAGTIFDWPAREVGVGSLRALAEAARCCPPIARSLAGPAPDGATMSAREAHAFVRTQATQLRALGIAVTVPRWSDDPIAPRLVARPRAIDPAPDDAHAPSGRPAGGETRERASRFSLNALVQYDWRVALGDGVELTLQELEALVARAEPLVQVGGRWIDAHSDELAAAIAALRARIRDGGAGERRAPATVSDVLRALLVEPAPSAEQAIDQPTIGAPSGAFAQTLACLQGREPPPHVPVPQRLCATLRPHQQAGMEWLLYRALLGLGACLADDMGTGKTLTTLAFLLAAREAGTLRQPALVVCPTSLVEVWKSEAERFAPTLQVRGPRVDVLSAGADVVVTSYGLLMRDEATFGGVSWGALILDEAQTIKNTATAQHNAVRRLHSPIRIALTGTPIENRLTDLWAIFEVLNPGYLGAQQWFHQHFVAPIETLSGRENEELEPNAGHDEEETDARRAARDEALRRLRGAVQPFILRRLKSDPRVALNLPEKRVITLRCRLTPEQVGLYEALTREGLATLDATDADDVEDAAVGVASAQRAQRRMHRRAQALKLLTNLKQVCVHPVLLDGHARAGDEDISVVRDGASGAEQLEARSGKLAILEDVLEDILARGERVLIFTQYTSFARRLQPYLAKRFGVEALYLHGGMTRRARSAAVARFQREDGPPLFVLSLKAGGVGLTLTKACHVIHLDRWWNPAVEDQASDRAYRIGQTQPVAVYNLICSGTLEERIDDLLTEKRALASEVMERRASAVDADAEIAEAPEARLSELSTAALRGLVTLGAEDRQGAARTARRSGRENGRSEG